MARILVIEDEAAIRANLLRFLRLEGHTPLEAPNGRAGLDLALAERPDLIFCDLMMPLMTGNEVLAAIQLEPQLRSTPFFFLSASAEPELLASALQMGASGYLTKPFSFAQLRAVLQHHVRV
jgi:CheY-like chemotaxis protein